ARRQPYCHTLNREAQRPTPSPYTTLFRSDELGLGSSDQIDSTSGLSGNQLGSGWLSSEATSTKAAATRQLDHLQLTGRRATDNGDRKSTRLNSSHVSISYAVFCLKKKKAR